MPSTPRRRPTTRNGRPVLTEEIIATKALEMAGIQGFSAVTMRSLAAELGVTVRALYNYVDDRQRVIDLAISQMLAGWQPPQLDSADWQTSVADYAAALRQLYRRWPRALLIILDEEATPATVHPNRLVNVESFLQLLRGAGLSLSAALEAHRHLALALFSFALLVDYPADHRAPARPSAAGIAASWLDQYPDLDLTATREAALLPSPTPDDQFDTLVGDLIDLIELRMPASGRTR
ncbi:TetR/AcrR family transcriptional regulator C-terminal domain-containing protein [Rhodococcus sp. PAM 2766]|uniref:TetR/AcrR family transcriptional regulator C-terminal domain-containing protein n=1 Tax=Rhodococcus parequi TaxID=3137122 RepID=A0ABW9FBL9_9NOCA